MINEVHWNDADKNTGDIITGNTIRGTVAHISLINIGCKNIFTGVLCWNWLLASHCIETNAN